MVRKLIKRCAIALAAWLPFFAIWLLVAVSFARSIFDGSRWKLDLNGKRGPARNRGVVRLPALAMASWVQTELLFVSKIFLRRCMEWRGQRVSTVLNPCALDMRRRVSGRGPFSAGRR